MRYIAVTLLLLIASGCTMVPPELPAAQAAQAKALANVERGYLVMIEAYDREARRNMRKYVDEVFQRALAAKTVEGQVPEADVQRLVAQRDKAWADFEKLMDLKREEFESNADFVALKRLNGAIQQWVKEYAVDTGLRVQELTREALDIFGVEHTIRPADPTHVAPEIP